MEYYVELHYNGRPHDAFQGDIEDVAFRISEENSTIPYDHIFDALERVTGKLIGEAPWMVRDAEVIEGWEIYAKRGSV